MIPIPPIPPIGPRYTQLPMFFTDHALAHRLEMADTSNSRRSGQSLEKAQERNACTEDIAGGCAIFAGVGSPITQAIGLGMNGPVTADDMERLEHFFESRGARVEVECCPFSHPTLREQFDRRGYRVLEWSNVLCQRLDAVAPSPPHAAAEGLVVRQAASEEAELWCSLLCLGFADEMGDAALTLLPAGRALFGAASAGFLAFVDGQAAGGGVIWIHDGVAGLMGASMLPAFRRRGGQSALMRMRLDFARNHGCDLAYTITAPGSGSQRNAERAGFRIVYTRTKLYKPA
jgi:GNAT superfamily N-acetyltransferase